MAKLLKITDPAEDAALIAARAYYQSSGAGNYHSYVAEGLGNAGFTHLIRTTNQGQFPVTLDREALVALFLTMVDKVGTPMVADADATARTVAEAAYYRFDRGSASFRDVLYDAIGRGDVPFTIDTTVPTWDFDALRTKYGRSGALPVPSGEHAEAIEAQRRAMTAAFLAVADAHGLCSTFDTCLASAGLSGYAPPREAEVSVEVEGVGTVAATVALTRAGVASKSVVRAALREAALRALGEKINIDGVTGLPAGALV